MSMIFIPKTSSLVSTSKPQSFSPSAQEQGRENLGIQGGSLTVRELDGNPTATITTLVFPNGTITIVGDVATITGLEGPTGPIGPQGIQGPAGSAGPNTVTTSTSTNITGPIVGNGTLIQQGSFGTTVGTFCQGNDARLSDQRVPTDGSVTLAKMANLAQDQFIGRTTASTGVPQTATITAAARTVLDDATVAAMVDTLGGASSTGTGGLMRAASPTTTGSMSAAEIVFSADARFTEQTYTPTGTTQTIDLNAGNLNTLSLGSTTGNLTLTLTVPTSAASGRIKIINHGSTPRGITFVLSSLTAKWFSVIPNFAGQAVGRHTILSYTRDGSFMNFSAVEEV